MVLKKKQKLMIQALHDSLGNVTIACNNVGIARITHYEWIKTNEEYKQAVEIEIPEKTIDFVENALFKQIKEGNMTGIIFFLKTKAKHRGYIERTEQSIEHKGEGISIVIKEKDE